LTPSGVRYFAGSGATRTASNLFPFTAGYTGWLGSCSDADPEGKKADNATPWYSGSQLRGPSNPVSPGGSTTMAAKAALVRVNLTRLGAASPGYVVTATHASGDTTCPTGESWTLGTTAADGSVSVAMPYGTWTIHVNDGGPDTVVALTPLVTTENVVAVAR
jgi:hypothetical protein